MIWSELIFLSVFLGMSAFAWNSIWSRKDTTHRGLAILFLAIWLPFLGVAAFQVLGWHKPLWAAIELNGKQRVIGHKLVRGKAIYLYLDLGYEEPRAYRLPWNEETATQLQKALRESLRRKRRGAMMKFDHSWDKNPPQFHPLPQPKLQIPKGREDPGSRYERGA